MGAFVYDTSTPIEIDDRTLAHIRLVVMTKLRRAEPFMFDVEMHDGTGRRSFWISPSVPLQFRFWGSRRIPINRYWIEQMMTAASGPNGLLVPPEPAEMRGAPPSVRPGSPHPPVDQRSARPVDPVRV